MQFAVLQRHDVWVAAAHLPCRPGRGTRTRGSGARSARQSGRPAAAWRGGGQETVTGQERQVRVMEASTSTRCKCLGRRCAFTALCGLPACVM
jgi:hypothetical protein